MGNRVEVAVSETFTAATEQEQHKALHESAHLTVAALCDGVQAMQATMTSGLSRHGRDLASFSVTPLSELPYEQELTLRSLIGVAPRCFYFTIARMGMPLRVEHVAGCDADFAELYLEHFRLMVHNNITDLREVSARTLTRLDDIQAKVFPLINEHLQAVYSVADVLLVARTIDTAKVRETVDPLRKDTLSLTF